MGRTEDTFRRGTTFPVYFDANLAIFCVVITAGIKQSGCVRHRTKRGKFPLELRSISSEPPLVVPTAAGDARLKIKRPPILVAFNFFET